MLTSRDQIQAVADKESDCVSVRNNGGAGAGQNQQGTHNLANQMKLEYDRLTDVMHVDVCFPGDEVHVDVVDVGDSLGFPGQIVARVNLENRVVYGFTIQRFSAFKRTLLWQYRMASIQRALFLLLRTFRAGAWMDHGSPTAHLPA
jgi:hypothetical protein